jgi:hypothetical protein
MRNLKEPKTKVMLMATEHDVPQEGTEIRHEMELAA